jgi:hypothetical protein
MNDNLTTCPTCGEEFHNNFDEHVDEQGRIFCTDTCLANFDPAHPFDPDEVESASFADLVKPQPKVIKFTIRHLTFHFRWLAFWVLGTIKGYPFGFGIGTGEDPRK